jgi:Ca-activated chloride channel family protein
MFNEPDYYAILGVERNATATEIDEAAARLNRRFPETTQDPASNPAYRLLVNAYEVLGDPAQRAAYDARHAGTKGLLDITTVASRKELGALDSDQLLYLLLVLRVPAQRETQALPLNVALVFDRSTSMRKGRLERVKAAARKVMETMSSQDIISVIAFSDRAEVVSPAARVLDRDAVMQRIHRVHASGGTEIYRGLAAAVNEINKAPSAHYVNHLILLTDGHTYGDEEQCLALASSAALRGITFSAFGIGTDWNDTFLDKLVLPSGGRSAYIDKPEAIVSHLQEQIKGLGTIYAHNVHLSAEMAPGTSCEYAMKLSPFAQSLPTGSQKIRLGAVESRAPLSVLLELRVKPQKAGHTLKLPVHIRAEIPASPNGEHEFHIEERLRVIHGEPEFEPPPSIVKAVQMLTLYRLNESAWDEFAAGNTGAATRRMSHLTARLSEAGHTEMAAQAQREALRLAQTGSVSADGRKRLKYGTRSLLSATISLDVDDHD